MKKLFIIPVVLLLLCACESSLDKAIPQSSLVGAISNINISFDGQGEWANRKKCIDKQGWCWESKDWTILKVDAFVPYDIQKEQVKPTLLTVFKRVYKEYPKCNIIRIHLAPDKEMAEILYLVGQLEYTEKKIIINYGIPSKEEMEKHNSQIGQYFNPQKIFPSPQDKNKTEKNNDPHLLVPDLKTYTLYKRILMIEDDIKQRERASKKKPFTSMKEYYVDLSNKIHKKIELPTKDIESALRFMHAYYGWNGYGRGTESIDLSL